MRIMQRGLIVLFLMGLCAFESSKMVRTKISDDISVLLPREFRPMDGIDYLQRYPSVRKSIASYTNNDRLVDFSVNTSASQWLHTDVELAQQFFKSSLYNLFDNVEMIEEGIHDIHKKKFIYFEFESRVKGDMRDQALRDPVLSYTYIQFLLEPNRTLVFTFTCPRRIRNDWQETAHKIMSSIKMK
jgi:hypothetical protein